MPKIYLSPERRKPPHGKYWGFDAYEQEVCREIAEDTAAILTHRGFKVKIADQESTMYERVPEAIAWGANYYLPIHTNASTDGTKEGTAQGPTVLAYGKPGGISWRACQMTYDRLLEIYPRREKGRGVKAESTFYEINATPMLSVYPEIAFHDNAQDAQWILENVYNIAQALAQGVCDWFGVVYQEPETNPDTDWVSRKEYEALQSENAALKAKIQAAKAALG